VAEFAHFRLDGAFAVVAADARHGIGPNAHLPEPYPTPGGVDKPTPGGVAFKP
jgi:hypothetical protein